jgi:hypothetical protein
MTFGLGLYPGIVIINLNSEENYSTKNMQLWPNILFQY